MQGTAERGPGEAPPKCFVIMPVSTPLERRKDYADDPEHFKHVLDHLFQPAAENAGFEVVAPVFGGSSVIHAEIIRQLEIADLVLCDMSILNPNVFFELGIRTAVDRPVALVRDDLTERVPFDTSLVQHHVYSASLSPWKLAGEILALSNHLARTFQQGSSRNAMWKYFGLTTRAQLPDVNTTDGKLDLILQALESREISNSKSQIPVDPKRAAIDAAWDVVRYSLSEAAGLSVRFRVMEVLPGRVELDPGGFELTPKLRRHILEYGKKRGVRVILFPDRSATASMVQRET